MGVPGYSVRERGLRGEKEGEEREMMLMYHLEKIAPFLA